VPPPPKKKRKKRARTIEASSDTDCRHRAPTPAMATQPTATPPHGRCARSPDARATDARGAAVHARAPAAADVRPAGAGAGPTAPAATASVRRSARLGPRSMLRPWLQQPRLCTAASAPTATAAAAPTSALVNTDFLGMQPSKTCGRTPVRFSECSDRAITTRYRTLSLMSSASNDNPQSAPLFESTTILLVRP
jgi:hypothetical protein